MSSAHQTSPQMMLIACVIFLLESFAMVLRLSGLYLYCFRNVDAVKLLPSSRTAGARSHPDQLLN